MRIKRNTTQLSPYERIFYFIWTAYTVAFFYMKQSEFANMFSLASTFTDLSQLTAVCLLVLVIRTGSYTRRQMLVYIVVCGAMALSISMLRDSYLLILFAFMVSGTKIDLDSFVRYDIKVKIFILCSIVGLCEIGVLNNFTRIINGTYKQALGFGHPNVLTALVTTILVEWIYIRYDKLKMIDYMGIIFSVLIIRSVSAARSSLYTFVFIFVFTLVSKSYPRIFEFKFIRSTLYYLPIIAAGISYYVIWLFGNGNIVAKKIDSVLTGRITIASLNIQRYGFTLFGQVINARGTRTAASDTSRLYAVDMSYIAIPLRFGVILMVLLCVGYILMSKKAIRERRYNLIIAMAFFLLFGIGETVLYRIEFNFTLIILLTAVRSAPFHSISTSNETFTYRAIYK